MNDNIKFIYINNELNLNPYNTINCIEIEGYWLFLLFFLLHFLLKINAYLKHKLLIPISGRDGVGCPKSNARNQILSLSMNDSSKLPIEEAMEISFMC